MLADLKTAVIVLDVSTKNQVATSISYIYFYNNPIIKTIYLMINITFTEVKLFVIRCSINQAIQIININYIIIIMNLIHAAKRIFDSLVYSYQIQTFIISRELREFLRKYQHNSIKF